MQRVLYFNEHGRLPEAGVGMTISERYAGPKTQKCSTKAHIFLSPVMLCHNNAWVLSCVYRPPYQVLQLVLGGPVERTKTVMRGDYLVAVDNYKVRTFSYHRFLITFLAKKIYMDEEECAWLVTCGLRRVVAMVHACIHTYTCIHTNISPFIQTVAPST